MSDSSSPSRTKMRFFKAGGLDQLYLTEGKDLALVKNLDQRLWIALSCPVKGLEADEETLKLIDTDNDGRIRAPEIIAAVEWTLKVLQDPSSLPKRLDVISLNQIDTSHPEGARLQAAAERILHNLGKAGQTTISLAESRDTAKIFAATQTNGDGIIPAEAASTDEEKALILDIIATMGGEPDRSGMPGVSKEKVSAFFDALKKYKDWWTIGYANAEESSIPLHSAEVESAYKALSEVRTKIDDYFTQCRLAAFDERAMAPLNFSTADLEKFKSASSETILEKLKEHPLAKVTSNPVLPLQHGLNPAWKAAVEKFAQTAIPLVLGESKDSITLSEWEQIKSHFGAFAEWVKAKAGAEVEKFGIERINQILDSNLEERILALIQLDTEVSDEIASIINVEKLIRFHRDLFFIVNNFVSFPYFYDMQKRAIFQTGALYMDGRCFHLCVNVDEQGKHQPLASLSGTFLMYCKLTRAGVSTPRTIVAAVTSGDAQRLKVGKNGIFYDRQDRDWDATVTHIVVNPISLREAVFSPFKRLGQLMTDQIEKISSSREKAIQSSVQQGVTDLDKSVATAPPPNPAAVQAAPPPPPAGGGAGGLIAGGGLAIAALSSSFAFISARIGQINPIHFFYTAVIFMLLVLVPSFIVAYLKLRARDIGQILEAGGWAVNGHMRISGALGSLLSQKKKLPPAARSETISDWKRPAWKRSSWWWVLGGVAAIVFFWFYFRG